MSGPVWREDPALDAALAALAPPSAPRTSAAQLLALGAAAPAAPLPPVRPSVTETGGSIQGLPMWKVAAVAMLGAALGLAALQATHDGPPPGKLHEARALGIAAMSSGAGDAIPHEFDGESAFLSEDDTLGAPAATANAGGGSAPAPAAADATRRHHPLPAEAVASVVDTGLQRAAVRTARPGPPVPPREAMLTVHVKPPKLDGQTRLRLAGGLLAAPHASRASTGSVGPELTVSVARLGPAEGPLRPLLVAELDLGTQVPSGLRTARFCGGAVGGAGFAIEGSRVRLELAWTGGARVAPDLDRAGDDPGPASPTLRPVMGPQLGVAFRPDRGPDIRLGATLQGSLERDTATDAMRVQPWVGVTAGIDMPVPRSEG